MSIQTFPTTKLSVCLSLACFASLAAGLFVTWTVSASHGDGSGQSYLFLEAGFTQDIFGVSPHFMGGVAFAPDGDAWVNDCAFSGSELHRYDSQSPLPPINGTDDLHLETVVPSNAGCGMTNHQNGFIYTNTSLGAVEINAGTGAPTGNTFGPAGNALGIAPDPQTNDVVYVAQNCRFTGVCDIITVDPTTGVFGTFVSLPLNFVDGIFFNPDGSQLFLATRSPFFAVTVVDRDFPGAKTGTFNRHILIASEPDGISFHSSGFVVTANTDGTMTKIVPGPDTVSVFASGGGRADLSQVGPDRCVYVTQDNFTRYDDGTTTFDSSLVRICPDFLPPPGVGTGVDIDIKFCSNPNAFNCKSRGKTPTTIFGTSSFDVNEIDISSLQLCEEGNPANCTGAPLSWSIADRGDPTTDIGAATCAIDPVTGEEENFLNPDGFADLDVAFDAQEVAGVIGCDGLDKGDTSLTLVLVGQTTGGTPFTSTPVGDVGIDQLLIQNK